MKIENLKLKIAKRDAFTLIEIMIAIAIVGILAAVVLVSMKSYAAKARSSKALAQLSSAIPGMIGCWGNGGKVNKPASAGGGNICSIGDSYGKWPSLTGDLVSYSFSASTAGGGDPDYCMSGCIDRDSWYIYTDSSSANDDRRICCTKKGNSCASTIKASGSACTDDGSWIN